MYIRVRNFLLNVISQASLFVLNHVLLSKKKKDLKIKVSCDEQVTMVGWVYLFYRP